jgi:hypothetical protein
MHESTPTQQMDTPTDQHIIFEAHFGNSMLVQVNPPTYTILAVTAGYEVISKKQKSSLLVKKCLKHFLLMLTTQKIQEKRI